MTGGTSERLRAICLALPEAVEKETWGAPTFRVRGRIFAIQRQGTGRTSVWFKAPPGSQAVPVGADPDRFFAPPYLGPEGWVAMHLDSDPDWPDPDWPDLNWDEVAMLVRRSYRLVAPKRLAALIA